MKQMRFHTLKFESDRLSNYGYDIHITLNESIQSQELIQIFENQLTESILDITDRKISQQDIQSLEREIKKIKKRPSSIENSKLIIQLENQLNEMMFIPEYVTVQINKIEHYNKMFKKGFYVNGVKYKRFNASAGQARVNTVLFIAETVYDELLKRTDNGRDLEKKIAPSKLNAYRGLYGSARYKVSRPKYCVIADYESETAMKVNFVTEVKGNDQDDIVEEGKEITKFFNRFDGQGLVSPSQALRWSQELGLDYVPAQFCLRGSFLKGMLCVFDIHEWVKVFNNGDGKIKTIYNDDNGNPIYVDINDVDVIVTESQMKLWSSWKSQEEYDRNCDENKLSWGISLYTPKYDKTFMYENYQFLQTLNLDDNDINKITAKFINWAKGVSSENVYYTMLFLLGMSGKEDRFIEYIEKGDNNWIRAFILEPNLIHDKYIRTKIYNLLKNKINEAAMGKIIVDGNFQVIVSDPFAMMEHVVGKEVKGLLQDKQHYSHYWNKRNVKTVVASRSPLTYRSEHVILNLIQNELTEKWYKHITTGIILNAHGDDTDRFAGSDFDYDILATTSDESVIKGVYRDELPVVYDAPKPKPIVPTDEDLFKADKFSFNSIIGTLTNKSTSAYALLADLNEGSEEAKITLKRIKTITKAQSAQIDKTKIGQKVKGVVTKWIKYNSGYIDGVKIEETEEERRLRELNNRILIDKHPYFFTHLYKNTRKKYKEHVKKFDVLSLQNFGLSLQELKVKERKTEAELKLLDDYKRFNPVIESDCVMNKICWRIESVDFEIRNLLKTDTIQDLHSLFLNENVEFCEETYEKVRKTITKHKKSIHEAMSIINSTDKNTFSETDVDNALKIKNSLHDELILVESNEDKLMNYVTKLVYTENGFNKDILWDLFGNMIVDNLKKQKKVIHVPVLDDNGELEYLNNHYSIKTLEVCQ